MVEFIGGHYRSDDKIMFVSRTYKLFTNPLESNFQLEIQLNGNQTYHKQNRSAKAVEVIESFKLLIVALKMLFSM